MAACRTYDPTKAPRRWKLQRNLDLKAVLPVVTDEDGMAMGEIVDLSRAEEPQCEVVKGLVGMDITAGNLHQREAPKGDYHPSLIDCKGETPTGWPPLAPLIRGAPVNPRRQRRTALA